MPLSHLTDYNDKLALVQGMTFMGQPVAEMSRHDLLYIVMSQELARQKAADHLQTARTSIADILKDIKAL